MRVKTAMHITIEPPKEQPRVYAVFRLVSDQYGSSELAGVYSTQLIADVVARDLRGQAFVKEFVVDAVPRPTR